jgi:hypothetical protein
MRTAFVIPCAALALAACAGVDRISYYDRVALYTPSLVSYASKSGEMPVEIAGNPFAAPTDAENIASALQLPAHFSPARLTTRPGPGTASNVRLVMAFNATAPGAAEVALCNNLRAMPVRPGGAETRVSVALCASERPATWLVAEGPVGDGPRDPRFQRLMASAFQTLMPLTLPDSRGDRPCVAPC